MDSSIRVMCSERGQMLLIHNNFAFRQYRKLISTEEQGWRCSNKTCNARIFTLGSNPITLTKLVGSHSHDPLSDRDIGRKSVSNAIKKKAEEMLGARPSKLIKQELERQEDVASVLISKDLECIRKNIHYSRLKWHPILGSGCNPAQDGKKAEDASSVGPSRKSPRVVPRKWPILPQEGVSVAESAISFQEVIHHDEEQESISMDESELDEGSSHLEKCRLCFMQLEDFTYIFEFHDAHHFHVGDVINDLMGLDVNPNDGYPSKICNYCLEELSHFRNFKRKCFETKARLGRIVEAGTDSEEDSEDAACPSGAGEIPVHSEAVESIVIKQEVDEPESHLQSESVINRSWNHASNSVEQVTVKEEVTSSSVDEVTFSEEFIIPDEPTSAGQVNELTKPCQPISVSKVADRKEVMVPYQPMSVNSLTVNKEIMMPCQPSSVGKVTVKKKLMIPSQHTSVGKVTVRKELILPCGTAGDTNNDGGGEVMGRERVTQVQGKHITMEVPNVPHPQSGDPEVPADGFFVPVKLEVDSDGEEVGDNRGGLSGEGRMAS